ncbi:hypothetical protein K2X05_13685 [bacterium]|nr:hypothetical protein [bacterium]
MIGPLDVLQDVISHLEKTNIEYFLVGSLASMYYGKPRFTNDIDLVVEIKSNQILNFAKVFDSNEYYVPPLEILQDEVVRGGSFNLIHHKSGIKIDIVLRKNTAFSQSEFSRKKEIQITPRLKVFIATAEDVIIKKLDYYREGGSEKHINDIREILAETKVDQNYIDYWVDQLGLARYWTLI